MNIPPNLRWKLIRCLIGCPWNAFRLHLKWVRKHMKEAYVWNQTMLWDAGTVDWQGYFCLLNCLLFVENMNKGYVWNLTMLWDAGAVDWKAFLVLEITFLFLCTRGGIFRRIQCRVFQSQTILQTTKKWPGTYKIITRSFQTIFPLWKDLSN